jgi:hypothetical protein
MALVASFSNMCGAKAKEIGPNLQHLVNPSPRSLNRPPQNPHGASHREKFSAEIPTRFDVIGQVPHVRALHALQLLVNRIAMLSLRE